MVIVHMSDLECALRALVDAWLHVQIAQQHALLARGTEDQALLLNIVLEHSEARKRKRHKKKREVKIYAQRERERELKRR